MSDFQAYNLTPDRWKRNHARALMFRMKIDDDAGISLVCSLACAFVAIVKSQSVTSHSEREFYKIIRVYKAPKLLREKKRLNAKNGTSLQLV